ncbi:MAG: RluA family pseudouridine synthase [Bacteriovoracaceae bacterium]
METELQVDADQIFEVTVSETDRQEFKRLDQFLAERIPTLSRSTIKRLFEEDQISISPEQKFELKKMPAAGTVVSVEVPPPIPTDLIAENIPLEVLFEDQHLIIINKPAGLVVHPAPGHYTGTLVNAILYRCPDLKGIGSEKRPGIVHRLDMGTSGVMVVAKDQETHEGLVKLFSTHDIERKYEALCFGTPKSMSGKIETSIGRHPQNRLKMHAGVKDGKRAVTFYKVLNTSEKISHLELKLETGRTHQIRVHLSQMLHTPVLCDPLYSDFSGHLKRLPANVSEMIKDYPYQMLHAKVLGFVHPVTKQELRFEAKPPALFQKVAGTFWGEK